MGTSLGRILIFTVALASVAGAAAPPKKTAAAGAHRAQRHARGPGPPPPLRCGDSLAFQVRLDRQGFSPGQINLKPGANFARALTALQAAHHLPPSGQPDCDSWRALGGDTADAVIATYTVSEQDVRGPFEQRIPRRIAEQLSLPALEYRSPIEELAERFHASPALLRDMNRGVRIAAGRELHVPAVSPFDHTTKPVPVPEADETRLEVSRQESALRVIRSDGTLVLFAPVTTGSEHDPLPPGDWKVTGVSWRPIFYYNPLLFWDAKPGDGKATINAGPNNPVGVVWIALNLEHYGLHGTPEPGKIGQTESHGCVRLTNWDAARVAALVKPGTPVLFR